MGEQQLGERLVTGKLLDGRIIFFQDLSECCFLPNLITCPPHGKSSNCTCQGSDFWCKGAQPTKWHYISFLTPPAATHSPDVFILFLHANTHLVNTGYWWIFLSSPGSRKMTERKPRVEKAFEQFDPDGFGYTAEIHGSCGSSTRTFVVGMTIVVGMAKIKGEERPLEHTPSRHQISGEKSQPIHQFVWGFQPNQWHNQVSSPCRNWSEWPGVGCWCRFLSNIFWVPKWDQSWITWAPKVLQYHSSCQQDHSLPWCGM